MKSFPTNFATEKDIKTGAAPVWILKCPFASGTVYLSDQAFTITGWDGSPTTKSWIRSWGQIEEDIAGEFSAPRVSDMALKCINDPDDADNIESILEDASNDIETTDCELYLWFLGLDASTDAPQKMWVGNIVGWVKEDELIYGLELVDQSVRIDKYVGTKINKTDYPNADPDDIGVVGNIGYGILKKVPARAVVAGALDYLDAAITAAQTTLDLVDASEFPTSGTVGLEAEEITYTGKTGNQLTGLTRGASSTTAAVHARGSVVWEVRSDFTYEAFSHPIKQFDEVYAEGHNTRLKITSVCTLYTGQSGSQHGTWPNKAIIVVPSKITREQAVNLLVNDGIGINDAIAVVDTIGVNDTITVNDVLTVSDNIGVNDPNHGHSLNNSTNIRLRGTSASGGTNPNNARDGSQSTYCSLPNGNTLTVNFPAANGELQTWAWIRADRNGMTVNSSYVYTGAPNWVAVAINTGATSIAIYNNSGATAAIYEVEIEHRATTSANSASTGVSKSGSAYRGGSVSKGGSASKSGAASKSGTVTKTGSVTMTGNSVADAIVADKLVVDAEGYQDDGSGTFTGTADALIEQPDHVFKHFLNTYASWPTADFYTDAASEFSSKGYIFAGVINQYKTLKYWLKTFALQCRCYFRFYAGQAQLLWRPDSLTSDKTVTSGMVRMQDDSRTTMQVKRSPLREVINTISVHYDRDWTRQGSADNVYKEITEASDSTSITKYGEKEAPDMFLFGFVTDQTMAEDLRDFYLARYKDRKKVVPMEVFLDNSEIEFADAVTLAPLSSLLCEVQNVNIYPGSGREMRNDRIALMVREY